LTLKGDMEQVEIVFVEVDSGEEITFKGTIYEIVSEIHRRQVIYGTVAYYVPLKVNTLLEIE